MKKIFFAGLLMTISLIGNPKAVVFDFGGVLVGTPDREVVVQFLRDSFQLSEEEFKIVNKARKEAMKDGQSGDDFWLEFAEENGISLRENWIDDFREVVWNSIPVRHEMYSLIEELKTRNLRVALLSNIDPFVSKMIREFGLYDQFDPCLLSCEIGVDKPDPRAYSILLEHLKLPGKEVLFIDDRKENIDQAQELGIDAILFESHEQIREELVKRSLL